VKTASALAVSALAVTVAAVVISAPPGRSAAKPQAQSAASATAPWRARLLDRILPVSLTGGAGSLYATVVGGTLVFRIVRIDPATGKVVASIGYPGQTNPPVIADGALWALWDGSPLRGYNLTTLATETSIPIQSTGQLPVPAAAVAAGPDGTLYVSAGYGVAVISAHSRRVIRTIPLPEYVGSLAVSPDGTRLYVAFDGIVGGLKAYNPETGALLATAGLQARFGSDLVATAGGVWGIGGTANSSWVFFAPAGNLSHAVRVASAGANPGASVSVALGAVWLGGPGRISCADPVTGRIRASAVIPSDRGGAVDISDVSYAGTRVFAAYYDTYSSVGGVVRIQPPKACTR
jgi:hypothetical protein